MERSASPNDLCSSPTEQNAPVVRVENEPAVMDSPISSPTSTLATTAPDTDTPRSSSTHLNQKQQPQHQKQQSGDNTNRRRRGTSSHRNSSFEYKETLDATTKHLEDGSRIINQYRLYQMIGQGAYGNVYEACFIHDPSTKFAIKEFGKTRLRKNLRAANLKRPAGRGGIRTRAGFAARGRGGRDSPRIRRSVGDGEESNEGQGEPESAADDLSKMSVKENNEVEPSAKPVEGKDGQGNDKNDPLGLIRHEIAILKKLDHPHVVELYEVLDDPSKDGLYMVFEHCADGLVIDVKLHEQVEPLDEETARDYLVQIMLGIEYLHHNDIVHRDIKPDNILLQDNRKICKIVDFGVSEMFTKPGDDMLNKSAGSPAFMSPELCTARHGDFHGKYSDVWSMGATFYCMVVGRLPFDKSQFLELYEAITKEEPDYPSHLSTNCKRLLQRLLEKDPKKRITLAEMRQDPFVTRDGTAQIMSEKENTSSVVVEVTDEEVDGAIKKIASVFTLARAISKFKRAGSRASSTSSLGEVTGHWIQKGKDMTSMPETEVGDGDEVPPSYEHLAAAHIAVGAHSTASAAKNLAKSMIEKGGNIISSPEADESQEEERQKGPPKATSASSQSYFDKATKIDEETEKEDEGREEVDDDNGKTESNKKEQKEGLLGQPQVSSPMSDDLPSPEDASAAYKGEES